MDPQHLAIIAIEHTVSTASKVDPNELHMSTETPRERVSKTEPLGGLVVGDRLGGVHMVRKPILCLGTSSMCIGGILIV